MNFFHTESKSKNKIFSLGGGGGWGGERWWGEEV